MNRFLFDAFTATERSRDSAIRIEIKKSIITIGYCLSVMAISIHLFVHFTSDLFRNFPGSLLALNCVLLSLQYVCSMIFYLLERAPNLDKYVLRTCINFISVYVWSVLTRIQFSMVFDLWRTLRSSTAAANNLTLTRYCSKKFISHLILCTSSPAVELALLWLLVKFAFKSCFKLVNVCPPPPQKLWFTVFCVYFLIDSIIMTAKFTFYVCCCYYIYRTRSSVKTDDPPPSKCGFLVYFKICGRLFVMSEINYTLLILFDQLGWECLKDAFYYGVAYHGVLVFATIVVRKSVLKYAGSRADYNESTVVATSSSSTTTTNI